MATYWGGTPYHSWKKQKDAFKQKALAAEQKAKLESASYINQATATQQGREQLQAATNKNARVIGQSASGALIYANTGDTTEATINGRTYNLTASQINQLTAEQWGGQASPPQTAVKTQENEPQPKPDYSKAPTIANAEAKAKYEQENYPTAIPRDNWANRAYTYGSTKAFNLWEQSKGEKVPVLSPFKDYVSGKADLYATETTRQAPVLKVLNPVEEQTYSKAGLINPNYDPTSVNTLYLPERDLTTQKTQQTGKSYIGGLKAAGGAALLFAASPVYAPVKILSVTPDVYQPGAAKNAVKTYFAWGDEQMENANAFDKVPWQDKVFLGVAAAGGVAITYGAVHGYQATSKYVHQKIEPYGYRNPYAPKQEPYQYENVVERKAYSYTGSKSKTITDTKGNLQGTEVEKTYDIIVQGRRVPVFESVTKKGDLNVAVYTSKLDAGSQYAMSANRLFGVSNAPFTTKTISIQQFQDLTIPFTKMGKAVSVTDYYKSGNYQFAETSTRTYFYPDKPFSEYSRVIEPNLAKPAVFRGQEYQMFKGKSESTMFIEGDKFTEFQAVRSPSGRTEFFTQKGSEQIIKGDIYELPGRDIQVIERTISRDVSPSRITTQFNKDGSIRFLQEEYPNPDWSFNKDYVFAGKNDQFIVKSGAAPTYETAIKSKDLIETWHTKIIGETPPTESFQEPSRVLFSGSASKGYSSAIKYEPELLKSNFKMTGKGEYWGTPAPQVELGAVAKAYQAKYGIGSGYEPYRYRSDLSQIPTAETAPHLINVQSTALTQASLATQESIQGIFPLKMVSETQTKTLLFPLAIQKTEQKNVMIEAQVLRQKNIQKNIQQNVQKNVQVPVQVLKQTLVNTQVQVPKQVQVQVPTVIEIPKVIQTQVQVPTQVERPPFPRTVPPMVPFKGETNKRSYKVLVRRQGIFRPIGTSQTLEGAFKIGKIKVENTAAASFKIVGASDNVPVIHERNFLPSKNYYESKKEPGTFIQRRGKRISSAGEKREITYKGIFLNKVRGTKKKTFGVFK